MTDRATDMGASDPPREAADLAEYPNDVAATLPPLLEPEEAASQIVALYEGSGFEGATFNLRFGDMTGEPLFSVSVYPDLGIVSSGAAVKPYVLQSFIEGNLDLLSDVNDPRRGVGLWYDADFDILYYDIVAILPDRQEAITLAQQYNQIAIYDLGTLTVIAAGGTGNISADMLPVAERLRNVNSKTEEEL